MILIEGLDLAGKSTLVSGLRQHYQQQGLEVRVANGQLCPENPVARVAREMVRWDEGFGGLEAGALFLSSHLWDLRHFRPVGAGTLHLQDSCWLRSLAFEKVKGNPRVAELMEATAPDTPPFIKAFVLTADLESRKQRYQMRAGHNDLHDQLAFRRPQLFYQIEEQLIEVARRHADAEVIDTSGLSCSQVLRRVVQASPKLAA